MDRFVGIVKFYQAVANLMIEKTDFAGRERNRRVLETLGEICERGFIVLLDVGTARLLEPVSYTHLLSMQPTKTVVSSAA